MRWPATKSWAAMTLRPWRSVSFDASPTKNTPVLEPSTLPMMAVSPRSSQASSMPSCCSRRDTIGMPSTNAADTSGMPIWPCERLRSHHASWVPKVPMSESTGVVGLRSARMPVLSASPRTKAALGGGSSSSGTVTKARASAIESGKWSNSARVIVCAAASRCWAAAISASTCCHSSLTEATSTSASAEVIVSSDRRSCLRAGYPRAAA